MVPTWLAHYNPLFLRFQIFSFILFFAQVILLFSFFFLLVKKNLFSHGKGGATLVSFCKLLFNRKNYKEPVKQGEEVGRKARLIPYLICSESPLILLWFLFIVFILFFIKDSKNNKKKKEKDLFFIK